MKSRTTLSMITAICLGATNNCLQAAEGGYSNYIPGTYGDFALAVEPAGKLSIRNDLYYYNAEDTRSGAPGPANTTLRVDGSLDFKLNFLTLLYKTDWELFGGRYAAGVFIPSGKVEIEADFTVEGNTFSAADDDSSVLGDLVFIPIILYWNRGNIHYSFSEFVVAPTGPNDPDKAINLGLNYWTFDTNFSVTYLNPETGQDYSVNLGYTYNTENSDTDYQTGQEIHIDVALNQFLSETFAVGIHGFHLQQITEDDIQNPETEALLGSFKGRASGIGPALLWTFKGFEQEITLIAKWMAEFDVKNRIEGDHFMLSVALSF